MLRDYPELTIGTICIMVKQSRLVCAKLHLSRYVDDE
jgi:hypothetical protein